LVANKQQNVVVVFSACFVSLIAGIQSLYYSILLRREVRKKCLICWHWHHITILLLPAYLSRNLPCKQLHFSLLPSAALVLFSLFYFLASVFLPTLLVVGVKRNKPLSVFVSSRSDFTGKYLRLPC